MTTIFKMHSDSSSSGGSHESFVNFDGSIQNFVLPKDQWNGSRSDGILQLSPRYIRKGPSPPSPRIHRRLQRSASVLFFPSKKTPPTSPRRRRCSIPRRLRVLRKKKKASRKRGETMPLLFFSKIPPRSTSPRLSPERSE